MVCLLGFIQQEAGVQNRMIRLQMNSVLQASASIR